MGLLNWLFGRSERPRDVTPTKPRASPATVLGGTEPLEVVGESFHQDVLRRIAGPTDRYVRMPIVATLAAEIDNPYDPNAIRVWISGSQVGHLSRNDAVTFRPRLLALEQEAGGSIALRGVIVGGGEGRPSYGVFLNYEPAAFGLAVLSPKYRSQSSPVGEHVRTGLSMALVSDSHDDTFNLGWRIGMPSDHVKAVEYLRERLNNDHAPISRHFLYTALEELLYRRRDESASALAEFDDTCEAHHAEMHAIRPALVHSLGGVPLLEMYRQAAIRHQKAHEWQEVVRWAKLGVEVYGADALRRDFVEDLKHRIDFCRDKLESKGAQAPARRARQLSRVMETLTCTRCGKPFERLVTPGRKPLLCTDCRDAPSTQHRSNITDRVLHDAIDGSPLSKSD